MSIERPKLPSPLFLKENHGLKKPLLDWHVFLESGIKFGLLSVNKGLTTTEWHL